MGVRLLNEVSSGGELIAAAQLLLNVYSDLACRNEHLLSQLVGEHPPRQWQHYPADDAISEREGFQWFYHSHSPEDRPDTPEHGHLHLFATKKRWQPLRQTESERRFSAFYRTYRRVSATRHLIAIGFDRKGLPISLFTVNSWVTGDRMLSAQGTIQVLGELKLATGYPAVDIVIGSLLKLYRPELEGLMDMRDTRLTTSVEANPVADPRLEILSSIAIRPDERIATLIQKQ